MSDSGAAGALAALLDQSVVAMAAKGAPGPDHDRLAVQDLADMWQENLMPLFAVMLTRSERRREVRARDLLVWMAGHGPVRRRVLLDLAAGAGIGLQRLIPWPHDEPVAPPQYTAERLALAGLQTMRIERDVLWPRGAATAAARALFQVLIEIRMAGRHRVVAGVPLAALTAAIAGAGQDLLRAGRSSAALTALTAKWQARPALHFDALAGTGPPAKPMLLAWHAADEWAAWHTGGSRPERPNAVYATAFDGDRLHGGQHLGLSRLRLLHRTEVLAFELTT